MACALVEGGVRPGDRVAIYMPKRVEALPALYGTMKAGAAYVPLDPKAPVPRMAIVAEDCAVAALVSSHARVAGLPLARWTGHAPVVVAAVDGEATIELDVPEPWPYEDVVGGRARADPPVAVSRTTSPTSSTPRARPACRRA